MKHIFGLHITQRTQSILSVQACLSLYGGSIRHRLGLHDSPRDNSSPGGLLLGEAVGDRVEEFYGALRALEGVDVQRMDFADWKGREEAQ